MEYTQVIFTLQPCTEESQDILCALLSDMGFDSFEYADAGVNAYIPTADYDSSALTTLLDDAATMLPSVTYEAATMDAQKDWNETWERENFDPILEREFGIKLDPRMAFGSGQHETTHQIVGHLMAQDLSGKDCLDMGTGTGVLGIAMALRGAKHVQMIDIDINSVNNAGTNCFLNEVQDRCDVLLGDASAIDGQYDLIVANIHKNILKADMATYVCHLRQGGQAIFSGFYLNDVPEMTDCLAEHGLHVVQTLTRNDWTVLIAQ